MDVDGIELLSEHECRELLAEGRVGRIAVAVGALAVVFPVNYVMSGDEILFWTAEGTKLQAAVANRFVTFEVDRLDPFTETGWSVMAVGPARERTEPAALAGAKAAGLRPWASGDRHHLVAVTAETVSGRRVGPTVDLTRAGNSTKGSIIGPHSPIAMLAQRPLRIDPHLSVRAAAELMQQAQVSIALVGHQASIITRWDLTGAVRSGLSADAPVASLGRPDGVMIDEDLTVMETATRMLRSELRHVILCRSDGQVTGLIGLHDLVRILLEAMDPAVWVVLRQTMAGVGAGGRR